MALDDFRPATLEDVLKALEDNLHTDLTRHRARVSAIHRIAHFAHRPPCDMPAGIPALRRLIAALHPAQCGIKPKSLSTLKSNLADALRAVGAVPADGSPAGLSPEWSAFLDLAVAPQQKWGVKRFADFCAALDVAPEGVTQSHVDGYLDFLDDRLLTSTPEKHCKSMIDTWNHLVKRNDLPYTRLSNRKGTQYRARPLGDYPGSLLKEIDAYLARLSHADIFEEGGPDKALRPTSLRNIEAHLRQYLDALVCSGMAPDDFPNLQSAVTPDLIKRGLRELQRRHGRNSIPSGFGNIAATLLAIARYRLELPESELKQIVTIKKKVSSTPRGMSDKNSARLLQFDDWHNVVLLLSLPEVLMDRADEAPVSRKSALTAMHAAGIAVLLSCPMRAKNVASLDLERHLRPRLDGRKTVYGIRIDGTEVKNGEPIEVILNQRMSQIVHRYITQFKPQLSAAAGTALFPRISDGKSRDPSNFSKELTARIKRETGIEMHLHLFRHLAALLYLKERPGDFETVRRLLKHKRLQTTVDFYAPLTNQWAHDHYDKVVLAKFGGSHD